MDLATHIQARPEAMGDVPGICELPLTRAVVQYRELHEMDTPGGRIEDIGLALVVEGRQAGSAEVLDLGSGRIKVLDLSTELVVLDWVYEPTLGYVTELIREAAKTKQDEPLRSYAYKLGLSVLERVGFGPLTRPTLLRIGYRDICRDFDLHEGTSIRFVLGPGRISRSYLNYDACALSFKTAFTEPDAPLEHALLDAFNSAAEVRRFEMISEADSIEYQVRLPLPTTFAETRASLGVMRRGLAALMARFEPDRYESVGHLMDTFGQRETLAGLGVRDSQARSVEISHRFSSAKTVH